MRKDHSPVAIVGESIPVRELRTLISRFATLDLAVLIQGPTGSGKELVARALHEASGRPGRFVAFNICAVAESMFEDALFGHVRGAFTGATTDAPGYLLEANNGTIFLDEIGGLAPAMQAKLLRAIESREFRPVGARADRRSDFRVVAATNEPLDNLLLRGMFRADLAHRLSAVVLDVPPLRERLEDIPALVRHFVASRRNGDAAVEFTPSALQVLQRHDWPGNVRELRNVVERGIALAQEKRVSRDDIRASLGSGLLTSSPRDGRNFARKRLQEVLEDCDWNVGAAARRLGVHRATIYRRMRRLGIGVLSAHSIRADLSGS